MVERVGLFWGGDGETPVLSSKSSAEKAALVLNADLNWAFRASAFFSASYSSLPLTLRGATLAGSVRLLLMNFQNFFGGFGFLVHYH